MSNQTETVKPQGFVGLNDISDEMPPTILNLVPDGSVVDDEYNMILSVGGVMIITGESGIGKSKLIQRICYSLGVNESTPPHDDKAFGVQFSAGFRGRSILYACSKDKSHEIKGSIELMAVADGKKLPDELPRNWLFFTDMLNHPLYESDGLETIQSDGWDNLWEEVKQNKHGLVIIDSLQDLFLADRESHVHAYRFIHALQKKGEENNCGVIILTHPDDFDEVQGEGVDPFDNRLVGGYPAWLSCAQGVLSMTWKDKGEGIITLASMGYKIDLPRMLCDLTPVMIDGFFVDYKASEWRYK